MFSLNLNGSNSKGIVFEMAEFVKIFIENTIGIGVDMSVIIGVPIVILGGLLMWLFATYYTGTAGDPIKDFLPIESNRVDRNSKEDNKNHEKQKKIEEDEKQKQELLEQEKLNKEKEDLEKREKLEKNEKELKEKEAFDWKQGEKGGKEIDVEDEKEGISRSGEAGRLGKQNTAERLKSAGAIYNLILEMLNSGKKEGEISSSLENLMNLAENYEIMDMIGAIRSFLIKAKENNPNFEKSLNLLAGGDTKNIASWFEKTAENKEKTANRMKDGPMKENTLKEAADLFFNAAEMRLNGSSSRAIANYEHGLELDSSDYLKWERFGKICIENNQISRANSSAFKLIEFVKKSPSREHAESCVLLSEKFKDFKNLETAEALYSAGSKTLESLGLLAPKKQRNQDALVMGLVRDYNQDFENKPS